MTAVADAGRRLRSLPLLLRGAVGAQMSSDVAKDVVEGEKVGVGGGRPQEEAAPPSPPVMEEPPEKPMPGDCCGSGCVRCVWDAYYDELEEYNNRRKKVLEGSDKK